MTNKKAIIAGVLAVGLSTMIFLVIQPALAVQFAMPNYGKMAYQSQDSNNSNATTIKGSVSLQNATNDFVKNNVKIPFNTAASTAQAQVNNGAVISGRLGVLQGYLVYVFDVADYSGGTLRSVVVDAGNGSVLYTSQAMTLHNGGIGEGGYGGEHDRHHHHEESFDTNENNESTESPDSTGP